MSAPKQSVAIVTGVSKGYGRAVADALLDAGWTVVGNARDEDTLISTANDLGSKGDIQVRVGDVTDNDHIEDLVGVAEACGDLRLLVNNAGALGATPLPPLLKYDVSELAHVINVNVLAPLKLIQLAVPRMQQPATVINITSDAAVEAYPGWGGYGASKAALDSISAVLGAESADTKFYALDPGDMRTDMHQAAYPDEDISDRSTPDVSAPAVLRLLETSPPSGRYQAEKLLS